MSPDGPRLIEVERHDHVVLIRLNQPDRLNVFSYHLRVQLADAMDAAEADPDVRALVLTGAGARAFSAGGDLKEMADPASRPPPASEDEERRARRATDRFRRTELPVIAAVNGDAYGGGATLALSCDIRLAAEHARFRFPGADMGLVVGAAQLPRLVGAARAKELVFTGRVFSAEEAYRWGFVNEVYPADQLVPEALAMAKQMAQGSQAALRFAKQVIDRATLDAEAVDLQNEANQTLRGTAEQQERVKSMHKRVTDG
ncbi:MAG: enoyl-CoA hydratase/isomerase family protein [Dehalococcoidia bacterium]|nr:enoyl-CoA hydratase/isomerase family protein [Dehalococcoidia bacterium]